MDLWPSASCCTLQISENEEHADSHLDDSQKVEVCSSFNLHNMVIGVLSMLLETDHDLLDITLTVPALVCNIMFLWQIKVINRVSICVLQFMNLVPPFISGALSWSIWGWWSLLMFKLFFGIRMHYCFHAYAIAAVILVIWIVLLNIIFTFITVVAAASLLFLDLTSSRSCWNYL